MAKVFHGAAKGKPGDLLDLHCTCCGSPLRVRALFLRDTDSGTIETFGVDCGARLLGYAEPGESLSTKKAEELVFKANLARVEALDRVQGTAELGVFTLPGSPLTKVRFVKHVTDHNVWYRVSTARPELEVPIVAAIDERVVWSFHGNGALWVEVA